MRGISQGKFQFAFEIYNSLKKIETRLKKRSYEESFQPLKDCSNTVPEKPQISRLQDHLARLKLPKTKNLPKNDAMIQIPSFPINKVIGDKGSYNLPYEVIFEHLVKINYLKLQQLIVATNFIIDVQA